MKVNSKAGKRTEENLRIKVLRKTVDVEYFKQKQNVNLNKKREKKFSSSSSPKFEDVKENVPKAPVKKRENIEELKNKHKFLNLKMISINFAREFGIERKSIKPALKEKNSSDLKSRKIVFN